MKSNKKNLKKVRKIEVSEDSLTFRKKLRLTISKSFIKTIRKNASGFANES